MSSPGFAYAPGDWVALVGPDTWGLVELEINDARVNELWAAASNGIEDVLDVLLSRGLRALPGFVLVSREGETLRYAVRRPAELHARGAQHEAVLDGEASDSWLGGRLDPATSHAELRAPSPGDLRLPTALGVMPASALVIDLIETRAGTDAEAWGRPAEPQNPLEPSDGSPPIPRDGAAVGQDSDPQPEPAPQPEPEPQPEQEPELEQEPDPSAEHDQTSQGHVETYFQLLVSSTMDRDELLKQLMDEPAAAGDAGSDGPDQVGSEAASEVIAQDNEVAQDNVTRVWGEELAHSTPDPPVSQPKSNGIIDGVPWASGHTAPIAPPTPPAPMLSSLPPGYPAPLLPAPPPPAVQPAPPAIAQTPPFEPEESGSAESEPGRSEAQEAEHDPMAATITKAGLLAQLAEERQRGPKLLAVRCQQSHLSPPYAVSCRVCGLQLSEQEPEEVTRPALGQLILSNGGTVTLDKQVIFGRAPQSDEEDAAKRPNLVRLVESGEISRMHATVTLDGWQLLLRDLGSQNGTFLTLPGHEPEQIRPNEDYVLEPGSVISFADVVSCTLEVTE